MNNHSTGGESRPQKKKANSSQSLLVLDDRQEIIDLVKHAARDTGLNFLGTMSNKKALKAIEELDESKPLRIAFLDIEVGPDSGLNVYEAIRSTMPNLPVVIISGAPNYKTLIPLIIDDPNVSYLSKPFTIHDIQVRIDNPHFMSGDVRELLEQAILMREDLF